MHPLPGLPTKQLAFAVRRQLQRAVTYILDIHPHWLLKSICFDRLDHCPVTESTQTKVLTSPTRTKPSFAKRKTIFRWYIQHFVKHVFTILTIASCERGWSKFCAKCFVQITCHVQQAGEPYYVKTSEGLKKVDNFFLHFFGAKAEAPTQMIRVEQSQSDRSKKPFHPVLYNVWRCIY